MKLRNCLRFPAQAIVLLISCIAICSPNVRAVQTEETLAPLELKKAADALKPKVAELKSQLEAKDYDAAIAGAEELRQSILDLLDKAEPKSQKLLRPIFLQLIQIRDQLALDGAELSELGTWEEIASGNEKKKTPEPMKTGVSFSKEIAPWLVSQCSRCHIDAKRGNLSLATFADVMKGSNAGVIVFAGDPKGSRLVEVLETGDMPRGGGKVSPENIEKLKKWITEGANFDGADSSVTLKSLVPESAQAAAEPDLKVMAPTGKETVSFSKDIAPVLIEQCSGCHIAAMRNSGGLRMDNFSQLLRGGNSGAIVSPIKSKESLLVKKLRGQSGQRMPAGGRPAMDEEKILMIEKWIDEGAAFDGDSPNTVIDQVASKAWMSGASHDEVREKRWERARQQWTVVMPKMKPEEASNDQFLILGNVGKESAASLLKSAEDASVQIRKRFNLPEKAPLVKGGIVIYAFRQRYEYSEFGKMVESRTLPGDWEGHWRKQVVDAYAVVMPSGDAAVDVRTLTYLLSSVYFGSYDKVPSWLAEGVGRAQLAILVGRTDPRVQAWDSRLPEVGAKIKDPKVLLDEKLDEEEMAIAGYALARTLLDKSKKRQFDTLLKGLQKGADFDTAFTAVFGPKEAFLKAWMGVAN
jgi:Planctomycete cytochrome C